MESTWKECRICGLINEHKPRGAATFQSCCVTCQAEISKTHYEDNKQDYMDRARERTRKIKEFIVELKRVSCADCGVEYPPCVMQFDHVRGEKEFNLSEASKLGFSIERIMDEIAKCEIVCANCHALRTWTCE